MRRKFLYLIPLTLIVFLKIDVAQAQAEIHPDSLQLSLKPYGSFRGHYAFYNEELEFQENASRVGFELGIKKRRLTFFAGVELGMNLFKSNSRFNTDGNTAGGFLVAENEQVSQVFNSRLGFLGLDLNHWGRISFGKQWGVYYDITSYTDKFRVFGGQGSATYVGGTDGGFTGTGRADQAVIYRNDFGPVALGLQLQARSVLNNKFFDGIGLSAQLAVTRELKIGGVFNQSYLNETLIVEDGFIGLEGQPTYLAFGVNYSATNIEVGAVYAHQKNGDLTNGLLSDSDGNISRPSVFFDADGAELFGRYTFRKYAISAGYNYYEPKTDDLVLDDGQRPLNTEFRTRSLILGFEYKPSKIAFIYVEGRISNDKNALGIESFNVLTAGLRIEADRMFKRTIMY